MLLFKTTLEGFDHVAQAVHWPLCNFVLMVEKGTVRIHKDAVLHFVLPYREEDYDAHNEVTKDHAKARTCPLCWAHAYNALRVGGCPVTYHFNDSHAFLFRDASDS